MKKVIISMVVIAVALFCTSCSKPSPTETVKTFLDGVKEHNAETCASVYSGDIDELMKSVMLETSCYSDDIKEAMVDNISQFDYEVLNEKIEEETANIEVKISNYDYSKAIQSGIDKYHDDIKSDKIKTEKSKGLKKQLSKCVVEEIKNTSDKDFSHNFTFKLTKIDKVWMIDSIESDTYFFKLVKGNILDENEDYQRAESVKIYKIGDTIKTEYFNMKIKDIMIVPQINSSISGFENINYSMAKDRESDKFLILKGHMTNKSNYELGPYFFSTRYIINGEYDLGTSTSFMNFNTGFSIEPLDDDDCFYDKEINENLAKEAKYAYIELILDNNVYIVKDKIHK